MAKSSLSESGSFWRTDGFVGVLVVLIVVLLYLGSDFIGTLERRFYDVASTNTSSSRHPSDRIAVIAIDDRSIANIGRWPWPRGIHAQLIDKLATAKSKVVVYAVFFFEPQVDRGLSYIRKMKEVLGADADPAGTPSARSEQLARVMTEAETALDTDGQLAASLKSAGNVILASSFTLGEPQGNADQPLPAFALKSALDENSAFSLPALRGQQPIERLGAAAAGIGHLNQTQDVDGAVRFEPLLVNYDGKAVPSVALLAATQSLNLSTADIALHEGESVQIGQLRVKTDAAARMLPQFYQARDGKPAFSVDSFDDVLSGKILASKYADKIVIIGVTATGVGTQFPVPGNPALSPAEAIAHVTSSILGEHFIVQPGWGAGARLALLLLASAYLIAALPRLPAGRAAVITLLLLTVLLGTEFGLLSGAALWLKLVFPATLLLIGHLALTTKRFLMPQADKSKPDEESAETKRMMGLALQGQGQLDMAFDRFRRVPMTEAVMGDLCRLALDFEGKCQSDKAGAVYQYMATYSKDYKDIKLKLNQAGNPSEAVLIGGSISRPGGALRFDAGAIEKPMLGRYQVEKELGKGAMGVVYLGRDPKIGRVVAIKTLALSKEFEGDELVDARERFFREAETAGRLQHQNIVTIFDAGEEHDLAYIAMEFLKGKDLADYCQGGRLLAVPTVLSIVVRVAQALDYAHHQHVVHRDIKPANIMYELESDTLKVTDFGIARITDSSKTRTGLVWGTPSFMSPEQLAGKKVDGRSDLYSLGVMLFQLLTGVLPFRGDSMAELMSKIANDEARDICSIRPALPAALARVVAVSLSKRPEARYQDGAQFAFELRAVLSALMGDVAALGGAVPTADRQASSVAEKTAQFVATVPASATEFEKTVVLASTTSTLKPPSAKAGGLDT
ncbi:serine/threonine protein kinase with Chase2 sensor [Rhodoferax ferrireducens T118]|uniref:non-specific serine/threonine protein kinase n=1 Tax=Albidiferax ferrireducens (strain ATCC BAA-621 / DSM 15236 / T118) TaxID=338969 RepID=Q21RG2_ALBFT|nr:serine/threonine-protein kinase [Rhodoferax ferrireducens]ABD71641.1 serine/threonine protein kinase with Chase2 sensor [Rhodoferax ferrireducens T118]